MNNTTTLTLSEPGNYFVSSGIIVPTEIQEILEVAIDTILIMVISIIGIMTNVFAINVFYRQGFKDSVNVSLTAIAFWDLIKCICGSIHRLYGPIGLVSHNMGLTWKHATHTNLNVLNVLVCYVTNGMTAYVAVERCLCVSIPFKIKALISPRFTLIMMLVISITVLGQFSVVFFIYKIEYVEISGETIVVYNYSDFYYEHGDVVMQYYNLMGVLNPLISFVIMVVSTVIIVYHLQKASKFRKRNGTTGLGLNSSVSELVLYKENSVTQKELNGNEIINNKKAISHNGSQSVSIISDRGMQSNAAAGDKHMINNGYKESSSFVKDLNESQNNKKAAISKGRHKANSVIDRGKRSNTIVRDKQVIKMLVVVVIVYVITMIPRLAHYIAKLAEPEFYFFKKYHNIFRVTAYIMIMADTINCITNIFIYLAMSSKFRTTFVEVFCRCRNSKKAQKPIWFGSGVN